MRLPRPIRNAHTLASSLQRGVEAAQDGLPDVVEAMTRVVRVVRRVDEVLFAIRPMMENTMVFRHDPVHTVQLVDPCGVVGQFVVKQMCWFG